MTSTEIIGLVHLGFTVIGGVVLLWQNKILKERIEHQKGIIDDIKSIQSLFDVQKLRDFAQLREETVVMQTDKEKKQMQEEMQGLMTKQIQENEGIKKTVILHEETLAVKNQYIQAYLNQLMEISTFCINKLSVYQSRTKLRNSIETQISDKSRDIMILSLDKYIQNNPQPKETMEEFVEKFTKSYLEDLKSKNQGVTVTAGKDGITIKPLPGTFKIEGNAPTIKVTPSPKGLERFSNFKIPQPPTKQP